MDFKHIIGHEKAIDSLQKAIKNDKISHSYLFVGEEGIGKKMVALAFAKTLLCKNNEFDSCNSCNSCVKFDTNNHPDFFLIESQKNMIKKEQIEKVLNSVMTKPLESKKKIFIINDSYKMNKKAQNMFLKTLEEPPSFVVFILINDKITNLLPTIVSRCEVIKFFPTEKEKIIELLTSKYNKNKDEAEFISSFSRGRVGKAIELSTSEDFFEKRKKTIDIIDKVVKGDKLKIFNSYDFFKENENNIEEILDIIFYWFRDLLIYKELGTTKLLVNKDKIELLSTEAFLSKEKINDIMNIVQLTKYNIDHNINYQLSLEVMLLKMQEV